MYSPDIVILDITMPLLNGIDTLKELLKMDRQVKVIMCTAMGQQSIINESLKIGAKDFIVKPYFHNLVSIVKKYC
jgi:two-component system, chemotaxis family, chemotaxis protein CheY